MAERDQLPANDYNRGRLEGLREALAVAKKEWTQAKLSSNTEQMLGVSHVYSNIEQEIRILRRQMGLKP